MNCLCRYKLIAFFALLCFAFTTQAQLSIEKHAKVAIDTDLTSLEEFNYFYADITGNAQLIFNSLHKQELTSGYLTTLPTINIQNLSSFNFNTAIQIDGDLKLNAKIVNIYSPIYMEGELQVANDTKIFGKENIQFQTQIQPQPFPFSSQHQTTNITLGVEPIKHTNTPTNQNFKQTKYYYKNIATYSLAIKIPTPPPEIPLATPE